MRASLGVGECRTGHRSPSLTLSTPTASRRRGLRPRRQRIPGREQHQKSFGARGIPGDFVPSRGGGRNGFEPISSRMSARNTHNPSVHRRRGGGRHGPSGRGAETPATEGRHRGRRRDLVQGGSGGWTKPSRPHLTSETHGSTGSASYPSTSSAQCPSRRQDRRW